MNQTQDIIKIYPEGSSCRIRLIETAAYLTARTGIKTDVADTFFDKGAGIMWTTLTAESKNGTPYMIASPSEQHMLLCGSTDDRYRSIEKMARTLEELSGDRPEGSSYDPDDKQSFVRDIAAVLSRVPAMAALDIGYGTIRKSPSGKTMFIPGPGDGVEAVGIWRKGQPPETARVRSITGDSLAAVFCDMAEAVSAAIF